MNKIRKTLALAVLLSMVTATNGQIFETEGDVSSRYGIEDPTGNGIIPLNGGILDQTNEIYTPVGSGVMLLAALGGAYLLAKKTAKQQNMEK